MAGLLTEFQYSGGFSSLVAIRIGDILNSSNTIENGVGFGPTDLELNRLASESIAIDHAHVRCPSTVFADHALPLTVLALVPVLILILYLCAPISTSLIFPSIGQTGESDSLRTMRALQSMYCQRDNTRC